MSAPIRPTTTQTHSPSGALLPGILCLHGGGSNSIVFKIQARRLLWTLGKQFRFVFVDGHMEGTPGHGMLPVFESCAPFYHWVRKRYSGEGESLEIVGPGELETIDNILRKAMEANGGVDSFVGVMGFSQGARLTAGLLLRQKMAARDGKECWTKFKFGVMLGGPAPPVALVEDEKMIDVDVDYKLLKEVPTVHGWGDRDPYKVGIVKLADLCDGEVSYRIEYDGDHHLPLQDRDARDLCDHIMAAWYAAGGERTVGGDEKY